MIAVQWKASIIMLLIFGLLAGSGRQSLAQDRSSPLDNHEQKQTLEQSVSSVFDWLGKLPPPDNRKAGEILEKMREIEDERRMLLSEFAEKALVLRRKLEDSFSRSLREEIQTRLKENIRESSLAEYRSESFGARDEVSDEAKDSDNAPSKLLAEKLAELKELGIDSLPDLEADFGSLIRELSSLIKRTLPKPGSNLYKDVEEGLISYYKQRGFSIEVISSYIDELLRKAANSLDRASLGRIVRALNLNISHEEEDLFEIRYDFEREIKMWWLTSLSVLDEQRLAGRLALLHDALSSVLAETALAVGRIQASILRQSRALESLYDYYPRFWQLLTVPVFADPTFLNYNERQALSGFIEAASLLDVRQISETGLYYPGFDELSRHFCYLIDLFGKKDLYRFSKEIGVHGSIVEAAYANLYTLLRKVYFSEKGRGELSESAREAVRPEELIDKLRDSFDDGRQSQVEQRWAVLQLLSDTESQVFLLREAEDELLSKLRAYLRDLYHSVDQRLEDKLLSNYTKEDFEQSNIPTFENAQLSGLVVQEYPDLSPYPFNRVVSIEGIFFDENGESFRLPLSYEQSREYFYSAFTEESQSRNSTSAFDEDAFSSTWGYMHGQIVIPSLEENDFQSIMQKMVFPQLANAQEIEDPVLAKSLRKRAFLSFLRIYRKEIIPLLTKLNVQPVLLQTERFHTVISLIEALDKNALPLEDMYEALSRIYTSSFSLSSRKGYETIEAYLANRILNSFSRLIESYRSGPLELKKLLTSDSLLRRSQNYFQNIDYLSTLEADERNRVLTHYLEELDYFKERGLIDEWFYAAYKDYLVSEGLVLLSMIRKEHALSWLEEIRLKGLIEPKRAQSFAEKLEEISAGLGE